jgi:large subunit ribosomal protein L19
MTQDIMKSVEKSQLKTDIPELSVGDTIDVHCRIVEGAKERIQIFNGVLIAINGGGLRQTMIVRRIVANEGVERTFPVHSPRIAKIEVKRHGDVRRAKLYYLRDRVGKKRRLRDRRRGLGEATVAEPEQTTPAAAPAAPAAPAAAETKK